MTAVTLLTQQACASCERAKAILEQVAADHALEVVEVDLRSPQGQDLGRRHGIVFAPGVLLDGDFFSYGRLSERKLRRELRRRAGPS